MLSKLQSIITTSTDNNLFYQQLADVFSTTALFSGLSISMCATVHSKAFGEKEYLETYRGELSHNFQRLCHGL